jgi:archaellum component FlaC
MLKLKFHIEECDNGWLLIVNPSEGKNPIEQAQIMFNEIKKIIPTDKSEIEALYEKITDLPQNTKLVFNKYVELLAYMRLLIEELNINN